MPAAIREDGEQQDQSSDELKRARHERRFFDEFDRKSSSLRRTWQKEGDASFGPGAWRRADSRRGWHIVRFGGAEMNARGSNILVWAILLLLLIAGLTWFSGWN